MLPASTVERAQIDDALRVLVRRGVQPYWVVERAARLLQLAAVRDKVDPGDAGDPDAETAALVEVLHDAIERLDSWQQRTLLRIVLGLDPRYAGRSARERRAHAGREFRSGEGVVKADTIRQFHEPRAIEALAELLWADERSRRNPSRTAQDARGAANRPAPYSGPSLEALRKALAMLVTKGLVPDNVVEKGGVLLALEIVASRMDMREDDDEDERDRAATEALTAVLREAVDEKLFSRKHRRLLRCVLPLTEEYLDMSVDERRTKAGRLMMGKAVKPGTVRTYYEPRALDELARALAEMEAKYRGEVLDASGV